MRYRKRADIEALIYDGTNLDEIWVFMDSTGGSRTPALLGDGDMLVISTGERSQPVYVGDYVVRDPFTPEGTTFYPMKPEAFRALYEPVGWPS